MGLWVFFILPLLPVSTSQPTLPSTNHTDLQSALSAMRSSSYYGFVILLQMLTAQNNFEQPNGITFLIPSDKELSETAISMDNLQEFLLSHSIQTPLYFNSMLHFPTGTLVPSGLPNHMITITNNGKSEFYVNNARIVAPNVCMSSLIKCHGINEIIRYDSTDGVVPSLPVTLQDPSFPAPSPQDFSNRYNLPKSQQIFNGSSGASSPLVLSPGISFAQSSSGGVGSTDEKKYFVLVVLCISLGLSLYGI